MSHLQQGPSQTSGMSQSGQPQNPELRRELMEAFNMLDTERKGYLNSKEMKVDEIETDRCESIRPQAWPKGTR